MNILILNPAPDAGAQFSFQTLEAVAAADIVICIPEVGEPYFLKGNCYGDATILMVTP